MRPIAHAFRDLAEQAHDLFVHRQAVALECEAGRYLEMASRYPCVAGHDQDPVCPCPESSTLLFLADVTAALATDVDTFWRAGLGAPGSRRRTPR